MEIHQLQIFMTAWFIYMLSHTSDQKTSPKARELFQKANTGLLAFTIINIVFKFI